MTIRRLAHDPPARACRRHRYEDRQSQLPRHGLTAYFKNGGTLDKAASMANHASTRTTQLYDRRRDDMSLDEVEKVVI